MVYTWKGKYIWQASTEVQQWAASTLRRFYSMAHKEKRSAPCCEVKTRESSDISKNMNAIAFFVTVK